MEKEITCKYMLSVILILKICFFLESFFLEFFSSRVVNRCHRLVILDVSVSLMHKISSGRLSFEFEYAAIF